MSTNSKGLTDGEGLIVLHNGLMKMISDSIIINYNYKNKGDPTYKGFSCVLTQDRLVFKVYLRYLLLKYYLTYSTSLNFLLTLLLISPSFHPDLYGHCEPC